MATDDPSFAVRQKVIYALSSVVRNYPPALAEALKTLPNDLIWDSKIDAEDMEGIDRIMQGLRDRSKKRQEADQFADPEEHS
jgi:hypothetical protein